MRDREDLIDRPVKGQSGWKAVEHEEKDQWHIGHHPPLGGVHSRRGRGGLLLEEHRQAHQNRQGVDRKVIPQKELRNHHYRVRSRKVLNPQEGGTTQLHRTAQGSEQCPKYR